MATTQGAMHTSGSHQAEEITRKREVRLMKNRWAEQKVEAKTLLTTASLTRFLRLQGGGSGMSEEKEGVRPVSGEPRGRAGEPEQDPDRGAESPEGPLLPQGRVAAAAVGWRGSGSGSSAGRDSRTNPL